eukprot:768003-Hanusia_phi.AAC.1
MASRKRTASSAACTAASRILWMPLTEKSERLNMSSRVTSWVHLGRSSWLRKSFLQLPRAWDWPDRSLPESVLMKCREEYL